MSMRWLERILDDSEQVVLHAHPHWRRLFGAALLVPLVVGVVTYGVTAMPGSGTPRMIGRWVVVAIGAVVLVRWSLWPWLTWRATHYLLTTQRLVLRTGVITRTGREIPLSRVNDVSIRLKLLQRLFGCGTIVVESGGERGQFVLDDVSDPDRWQREIHRLTAEWGSR